MKALAIIINLFFPGIGTLIVKKFGQGIAQILLGIFAAILVVTGIFSIIGIPLAIGVWIWAIISVVNSETQPVTVVVQQQPNNDSSNEKK